MSGRIEHALGWHLEDWSDFELRLVVPGRLIVKKNNLTVLRMGQRVSMGPNGDYKAWERDATDRLSAQWNRVSLEPIPEHVPLNLRVVTYLPNRRGWPDLSATYEGPQDVLEAHRERCDKRCRKHAGVITNDRMVCGHVGSARLVDADNPRVELTLTPHRAGATR